MTRSEGVLGRVEPWSGTLFLVAGALSVVYATLWGLVAFAGIDYPILRDVVFRIPGYVIGFVALVGLYPSLADRSPKLAAIGAVFGALGAVGWLVDGLAGTSRSLAAYLGTEPPAWLGAFGILILLGFVLGHLSFGVASIRTDVYSRAVGVALLTPLVVVVVNLGIVAAGLTSPEGRFVVSSGFAIAHLAIGFALRTDGLPIGRANPQPAEVGR